MSDPPRPSVLFLALPAGVGGSVRSLATVLRFTTFRRVVAFVPGTSTAAFLGDRGLVDEAVPCAVPAGVVERARTALRVFRRARRIGPSLIAVHANSMSDLHLVAPIGLLLRRRVVVWVHETDVGGRASALFRFWCRTLPRLDVCYVSTSQRDALGLPHSRGRTEVVGNPIDPDDVVAPREPRPSGSRTVVGYLGTPARYKGFHLLPELIERTAGADLTWKVFAGPRSLEPGTWQSLEGLDSAAVELQGKVADVGQAYAQLDIVVCPSSAESYGRVVAEAMANGLAVVAFDLPAIEDLVQDGVDGVLVPTGDVDALVAAVVALATDGDRRRRLGAAARSRAAGWRPAPVVARLDALYAGA